jgi:hypothetical protein
MSSKKISNEIYLENKITSDYEECIGNRVIPIDDISSEFSDESRSTNFSVIDSINLDQFGTIKYYFYIYNTNFEEESQIIQLNFTHDGTNGFLVPFGRVDSSFDLGTFDFKISETEVGVGNLEFYPTDPIFSNYSIRGVKIKFFDGVGIGSTNQTIGNAFSIRSSNVAITSSILPSAVGISSFSSAEFSSSKFFIEVLDTDNTNIKQFNEFILVQNGVSSILYDLDYGTINTDNLLFNGSSSGLGTFGSSITGGNVFLQFTPLPSRNTDVRIFQTGINNNNTGIGSLSIGAAKYLTSYTSIASTTSPIATRISGFSSSVYAGADCFVEIKNVTDNTLETSQVLILHNDVDVFYNEFASVATSSGIGTISCQFNGSEVELVIIPPASKNIEARVIQLNLPKESTPVGVTSFKNFEIENYNAVYLASANDTSRTFTLTHKGDSLFYKEFDGSSSSEVDVTNNVFNIKNHFFTTGEPILYTSPQNNSDENRIGIATTSIVGVGTTNKLPSNLFAIKVSETKFKVAETAEKALSIPATAIDITDLAPSNVVQHSFKTRIDAATKSIISLDNTIQSPLSRTNLQFSLAENITDFQPSFSIVGIVSFSVGDLLKIDNEFVRVKTILNNQLNVDRGWLSSDYRSHSIGTSVTKYVGDFQINNDKISFVEPPKGLKGYSGIHTSSIFSGRVFLRSGVSDSSNQTYLENHLFDDISDQFDGSSKSFNLRENLSNVTGVSTYNGLILINQVPQHRSINYVLEEKAGITSITFVGSGASTNYDVNTATIPKGGVIVSVDSGLSYGYQPLVSAGGTAIISGLGTIASISIGNSGSGYRSGIQTNVSVKIRTNAGIVTVGTGNISSGIITSVTITNPGSGYTSSNPPSVIFDDPLPYENLPLNGSLTGIGGSVSIIVGSGLSVINYEITNFGRNYKIGDQLTIQSGGPTGIPTDSSVGAAFSSFTLRVTKTYSDSFSGWCMGELLLLDSISEKFDGVERTFKLTEQNGIPFSYNVPKGSQINLTYNFLVFVNDVLQIPIESYKIVGGLIRFTEAPQSIDKCEIYFYKGSSVDIKTRRIISQFHIGDGLEIKNYPEINDLFDNQTERTLIGIETGTINILKTNTYQGNGISDVKDYLRPLSLIKQTSDLIIDGIEAPKDRPLFSSRISPISYLINNVSTASTEIFVNYLVPLFNEYDDYPENLSSIKIIDQQEKSGGIATAIVSGIGSISSIVISDGGVGFTTSPIVSIASTTGIGTVFDGIVVKTSDAFAIASISGLGTVSSISIVNGGLGYTSTNPPNVLIESEPQSLETITDVKYSGDFGIITGIGTTSIVEIATTGINFDLFIPLESPLRDSNLMTSIVENSGIKTNYYFVVTESNIGSPNTSYSSASGSPATIVGVGTTFIDNVYRVVGVSTVIGDALGVGSTVLTRVTVSVDDNSSISTGSSEFYGNYSWGRLFDFKRENPKAFVANVSKGPIGVETGPLIMRTIELLSSYDLY